ncbi:sensor histidine kinase [Paenirhodobacter sp.]|uniref:sensor histidine kinase n=1 Tax=Paenirhodobacter sp. TaxID=1965326 RepID=UPI003B3C72BE
MTRIWALFDRLGARLALVLAIALFPLLLLSVVQSRSMAREAQARSEAALMGETLRAVSVTTRLIQQAEAETRLLAFRLPMIAADPRTCNAVMRDAKAANPHASFVGFARTDGLLTCSSEGKVLNVAGSPRFEALIREDGPAYAVSELGYVSETSVLTISYPVRDKDGQRIGIVGMSLPHDGIVRLGEAPRLHASDSDKPLAILTFDRNGTILTASGGMEEGAKQVPVTPLNSFHGRLARTFMAQSVSGQPRIYSVVDLIPDQLYALGSWPADEPLPFGPAARFPPSLVPALMWAASLFVAYFATQKMVTGYVKRLGRALRSFASGNRIVADLGVEGAPREIRDLAETYEKMTETILHDEAELEDTIHHKEVLLREVHHRVKNNLQLIASIINMQVRRARTPETKAMLKGLQERVIGLATVHRGLYMTSGLTDINANELIRDIVRQLMRATTGPDRKILTEVSIEPIQLTPDQAVPLSLLLTEAMTNAVKYASADTGTPALAIGLNRLSEGRARLEIRNSLAASGPHRDATAAGAGETGLGSQLLNAFVQQLGGVLRVDTSAGTYAVVVEFDIRSLKEGELRHEEAESA